MPGPHRIQGIGAGFVPGVLNTKAYDEVIQCAVPDAFEMARRLARTEGVLVGMSAGANVWAELGSTWFLMLRRPTEAAHVLGKLLDALQKSHWSIIWA